MHHDEDAEVYLNGVLAAKAPGYGTDYEEMPISDEARAALRPGRRTSSPSTATRPRGGQYIDVGLGAIVDPRR